MDSKKIFYCQKCNYQFLTLDTSLSAQITLSWNSDKKIYEVHHGGFNIEDVDFIFCPECDYISVLHPEHIYNIDINSLPDFYDCCTSWNEILICIKEKIKSYFEKSETIQ